MKTVLVIPNYNMKPSLGPLLEQALRQGYDDIVVLDDASTDGSANLVRRSYPQVQLVAGRHNLGSSGNRNRIFEVLGGPVLLHFVDADMEFCQEETASLIRGYADQPRVGFVGGLVYNSEHRQSVWNYGPRQSLYGSVASVAAFAGERFSRRSDRASQRLGDAVFRMLPDSPNPRVPPKRRTTFWVNESNLVIRSEVLARCGMFDSQFIEHDIQPLALRTQEAGYVNIFDPSFAVCQVSVPSVRHYNRARAAAAAEMKLAARIGFTRWLMPGGHFRPSANVESESSTS